MVLVVDGDASRAHIVEMMYEIEHNLPTFIR